MMIFEIPEEDEKKINEWYESIKPKILSIQKQKMSKTDFMALTNDGKTPYYGTIGGGLKYTFIPTGIGLIIKVKEHFTGEELDTTDYDMF